MRHFERTLLTDLTFHPVDRRLCTSKWYKCAHLPSYSLREKDAIEELYEIVKFRCRIKSIPIQLDVSEIDAIGTSDTDLELLLIDGNLWLPDTEEEHLLKLQEKLNNYIYFLESKQYVERYGDKFDKKVIQITFQYSPSDNGLEFLAAVQKVLQPTDMSLKVELPE